MREQYVRPSMRVNSRNKNEKSFGKPNILVKKSDGRDNAGKSISRNDDKNVLKYS